MNGTNIIKDRGAELGTLLKYLTYLLSSINVLLWRLRLPINVSKKSEQPLKESFKRYN